MGQKVHPLGFRIGATQDHYSHWFAKPNQYPQLIQEDKLLRSFINRELTAAGISEIHIQRKADRIELEIHVAKPRFILGSRGVGINKVREDLEKVLSKASNVKYSPSGAKNIGLQSNSSRLISISLVEISNPNCKAKLIAEFISQDLEKRIPFRRVVKKAIQKAERAGVKGIKIQVSGRLNGAEIARSEWVRTGSVSLQTLRTNIDYCSHTAQTIYGILGIKVWISNDK